MNFGTFCGSKNADPRFADDKALLSVDRQSTPGKRQVLITIENGCVGAPEEAKTKLFTPLFTTNPKWQGFGSAVVKHLSEQTAASKAKKREEPNSPSSYIKRNRTFKNPN